MNVITQTADGTTLVKVVGRVDTTTANDFQNAVTPLMEAQQPKIEIDCTDLEYTSSQGLRIFLMLQKAVTSNGGTLLMKNMRPSVKEIFDITGFSSIMTIE